MIELFAYQNETRHAGDEKIVTTATLCKEKFGIENG
jgi:hypothetical protein